MDFDSEAWKGSYTGRQADPGWLHFMQQHLEVSDVMVVDVGCGGGIYSRGLVALGAKHVTGIDLSAVSLADAKAQPHPRLTYLPGDATALPVHDASFDILLARALVHHLPPERLERFAAEAWRCLKPEGTLVIQDRTPEDALAPGRASHPRGYLFELFPEFRSFEVERRHTPEKLTAVLHHAGFTAIKVMPLTERRKTHADVEELLEDVRARRGRSILHRLTDEQLERYAAFLERHFVNQAPVLELEPWTVYIATGKRFHL